MQFGASFDSLPCETLLNILYHVQVLDSLDAILSASPGVWRVFTRFGVEVTHRILEQVGYIHPHSRTVIRTIAAIRLNCLPVYTVADLQHRVTGAAILPDAVRSDTVAECFAPSTFPDTPSTASVIRSILKTATRISNLTLDCLHVHLQRFQQHSPQVPEDPAYNMRGIFRFGDGFDKYPILELRVNNPSLVTHSSQLDPPDWTEEQIIYRAFWRIQLVQDLKRALEYGILTGWVDQEVTKLLSMDVESIYDFEGQAWTIANYETRASHGNGFLGGQESTEHSAVVTAEDYMVEKGVGDPPLSWTRPWPFPSFRPDTVEYLSKPWSNMNASQTTGLYDFHYLFEYYPDSVSPSFACYRRLGFAIWTDDRLQRHGFAWRHQRLNARVPSVLAWCSILPNEDVMKLEQHERVAALGSELSHRAPPPPYNSNSGVDLRRLSEGTNQS
ncbi:hypothetical protein K461DRAFT_324922 [Myriangium duriaei CBS 260.36]|uniref:F-box domain-containing protein n=1 Tax=Myriangium duriaei CBS 260.36 TaxID=1168546 RepID=A0A9P4IU75_9PEZI|nr:hypothetical protein K461DRAFT_324922 [Myriangium duriaei CBS 260.36]